MAKQGQLNGTERPAIKDLDQAVASYIKARDERQVLTRKEVEAKAILDARMHEHAEQLEKTAGGGVSYLYQDGEESHLAKLEPKGETLKVERVKDQDPE